MKTLARFLAVLLVCTPLFAATTPINNGVFTGAVQFNWSSVTGSGLIPTANLGTGTLNNTTVLFGDGVFRAAGTGNVSLFGTPSVGQVAIWQSGTTILGQTLSTWSPTFFGLSLTRGDGANQLTLNSASYSYGISVVGSTFTLANITGTANVLQFDSSGNFYLPILTTNGFLKTQSGSGETYVASAVNVATDITGVTPIANGGTASSTVAAGNQAITPSTVTVTETTGASTVNWASSNSFYLLLNANVAISFSGAVDGQVITLAIRNTASNYTVAWPTIKWTGGVTPTQTTGAHYDVYTIWYNAAAGAYFGAYVQNY